MASHIVSHDASWASRLDRRRSTNELCGRSDSFRLFCLYFTFFLIYLCFAMYGTHLLVSYSRDFTLFSRSVSFFFDFESSCSIVSHESTAGLGTRESTTTHKPKTQHRYNTRSAQITLSLTALLPCLLLTALTHYTRCPWTHAWTGTHTMRSEPLGGGLRPETLQPKAMIPK